MRRYEDNVEKRIAYENACDCLYYGMGQKYWDRNGLDDEQAAEVWKTAVDDLAESE